MGFSWPTLETVGSELQSPADFRRQRSRRLPVAPVSVDGLLLEFSGVIYDPSPWRRWLFQLVSRMGLHAHYQTFHRVWEAEYQDDVNCGRRELWEAIRSFLMASGMTRNQTEEVEAAGRAKQIELEQEARSLPGVVATIEKLSSRGVLLALIGNVPLSSVELEARLQRMQLAGRFNVVLGQEQLASARNRADRLRMATTALGLTTTRVALVSSEKNQLRSATSVGASTIALNYESDAQADVYIDQFDHLLQVVHQRHGVLSVAG